MGVEQILGWQTSGTPTRGVYDHAPLRGSREFVNVLLEKKTVHEDILTFQNRLLETLYELTLLLEDELVDCNI